MANMNGTMKEWLDSLKPDDPVIVESDRQAELRTVEKIKVSKGRFNHRVICVSRNGGAFTERGRGKGNLSHKWLSKPTAERIKSLGAEQRSKY